MFDGCFCKCSVRCLLLLLSCEFSWTSYLGRIGTYNHVHCNNLTVILMHLDHLDHPPHPALRTPRDVAMPTMFRISLAGAIPMLCGDIVAQRPTNFQPSQFSPCIAKCNNVHLPNHCSGTTRTRQYRPLLFKSLLGAPASRITKCRWCCLWQFNFSTWANENGSVSFFAWFCTKRLTWLFLSVLQTAVPAISLLSPMPCDLCQMLRLYLSPLYSARLSSAWCSLRRSGAPCQDALKDSATRIALNQLESDKSKHANLPQPYTWWCICPRTSSSRSTTSYSRFEFVIVRLPRCQAAVWTGRGELMRTDPPDVGTAPAV